MKSVQGKHITIMGAARSGIAMARLLQKKGAIPFVTDNRMLSETTRAELKELDIRFEEGGHTDQSKQGYFLAVSPGVPTESSLVQWYLNHGRSVFSEVEIASWFTDSDIYAVTGTNGKTTTTAWLGHLWDVAGRDHRVGGNIGIAFSSLVDGLHSSTDLLLEVSSFQLDHIEYFSPKVSMILNITPDHLDRYQNKFENYVASKMRIFENQGPDQITIFNHDDDVVSRGVSAINAESGSQAWAFSALTIPASGIGVENGIIYFNLEKQQEALMEVRELSLKGTHNLRNGLAAALAARAGEIDNEYIRESLATFKGVAHRLEFVRELDSVRYINDSKATNVNSVWYALESFEDPIVLILGGVDKGNDYSELASLIRRKVRAVIALGEGKAKIEEQLGGIAHDFASVNSLEEAIETAREKAQPHDVVLLSPACASFDMFDNYEHRGEIFKELVKQLR